MNSLETRVPPPLVFAAAGAVGWGLAQFAPGVRIRIPGADVLATGLAVIGGLSGILGIATFRRASTTVDPHRPAEASTLVTSGIYRFTRNPMYLGLAILLVAWSVRLATPLGLAGVVLFVTYITRYQILPEERALRAAFGERYERYTATTRRWV